MVVIRLTRVGKKKQAHYRIVVADLRRAVQGKFLSILGWYNPHTKELQVKKDELQAWFDKGAQPSNTLAKLLKREKIELPKWVKIVEKKKAPKKAEEPKKTEEQKDVKTEGQKSEKIEASTSDVAEAAEAAAETSIDSETPKENAEPEAAEEVTKETAEEPISDVADAKEE